MPWNYYGLDNIARDLVRQQNENTIKESHKMRAAVAYGLERFWGEQLRLEGQPEAAFWRDTWDQFVEILQRADVTLPQHQDVNRMAEQLWDLSREEQQIALAVLTQLCDCLVWWTQRYKNTL